MTCIYCKWERNIVDLLVTPATKPKPRWQDGTAKMSGCNKLWQLCAVDTTGPVSNNGGEQLAGGLPPPRARAKRKEGRNGEGCERSWKLQEKATRETIKGVRGLSVALMGTDE
jgi:hypothetical protein